MKFFSRSSASRNAASFMLAVWLFVLASGVANACLLEAPDHGGQQRSSANVHSTDQATPRGHGEEQGSRVPCVKACEEGSQALQATNGMDSVNPGSAPLAAVLWRRPMALSKLHQSGSDTPPSVSDPPERIIYSRWAL